MPEAPLSLKKIRINMVAGYRHRYDCVIHTMPGGLDEGGPLTEKESLSHVLYRQILDDAFSVGAPQRRWNRCHTLDFHRTALEVTAGEGEPQAEGCRYQTLTVVNWGVADEGVRARYLDIKKYYGVNHVTLIYMKKTKNLGFNQVSIICGKIC